MATYYLRTGGMAIASLEPETNCLAIGPLAEIMALSPQLYATMDTDDGGGVDNDGSESIEWDFFGSASIVTTDEPFCEAMRLNSTPGGTLATTGVAGSFSGATSTTTYSAFVKLVDPLASGAAAQMITAKGNTPLAFSSREHFIYISNAGEIIFRIFSGGTAFTWTSSTGVYPDDQAWHMVSAVFNASTSARIYIDGVQVFSTTSGIPATKNNPSTVHSWGSISSAGVPALSVPFVLPLNGYLAHGFIAQSVVSATDLLGIYTAAFA